MSRLATVLGAVSVGSVAVALPVVGGLMASNLIAAPATAWPLAEGLIVGAVLALAELLGLYSFGRWVRLKQKAERLAARNARIRAGAGFVPAELP